MTNETWLRIIGQGVLAIMLVLFASFMVVIAIVTVREGWAMHTRNKRRKQHELE